MSFQQKISVTLDLFQGLRPASKRPVAGKWMQNQVQHDDVSEAAK